jgi:hypothetical protein
VQGVNWRYSDERGQYAHQEITPHYSPKLVEGVFSEVGGPKVPCTFILSACRLVL